MIIFMKLAAMLLVFSLVLISACVSQPAFVKVSIGSVSVDAEVASTPEQWKTGLMYRETLAEGHGMLFVFPDSQIRSFWMKNTLVPLDIIFIGADKKVVSISQAGPCTSLLCENYVSERPAMYVLEVSRGFAEQYGISRGDIIEFDL